jgi:large subunit ribosomal protein L15
MLKYDPDHFGRHGFKRPPEIVEKTRAINLAEVEQMLKELANDGSFSAHNSQFIEDLLTKLEQKVKLIGEKQKDE